MLIIVAADGEVTENEIKVMAALVVALPCLDRINQQNIAEHLEHFALIRKTMSADRVASIAVSVLGESLYPAAYAAVVEAAVADGILEDAELAFLDQLKEAFKLEPFTFQAIEYSAKTRYQVPD